jgi:hypothetical protein
VTHLQCRNCGSPLDPRRVELGYDYCLKEECQERCVKRVHLAALGVNKAADYYVRADEVLPPPGPEPIPSGPDEDDEDDEDGKGDGGPGDPGRNKDHEDHEGSEGHRGHDLGTRDARGDTRPEKRPRSTLERLRQREAELDRALAGSYDRFRRSEITAREMEAEQRRLVAEFNELVRAENIRYRSLLRGRAGPKPERKTERRTERN